MKKVRKQCSRQNLQGPSIVNALLSRSYYSTRSCTAPPLYTYTRRPLSFVPWPIPSILYSIPIAPQDLSFLHLSQNVISQGHLPTLKDRGPGGKEIKTIFLVEQHESAAPPSGAAADCSRAVTFSDNQYLIINHNHNLMFTFGDVSGKGRTFTFLHDSKA